MSKVNKNYLALGVGTNDINSRVIPANFTPTNYTPEQVGTEGADKISSNLKGIDVELANKEDALGNPSVSGQVLASTDAGVRSWVAVPTAPTGDIGETSYTKTTDVELELTNEVITGLLFAEDTVRSFEAQVSIQIDTTVDTWQVFKLTGIQKGSGVWDMSIESVGDTSLITLTIASVSSSGQVRYSVPADASRTAINMKFRAFTLSV